jgi:phosphoglycerate kinase
LEKELKFLKGAVDEPKRPFSAIVGGAKVSTKIPVIESLIEKCDKIFVGGGMIFTFYKALGYSVGNSLVEEEFVALSKELLDKAAKIKALHKNNVDRKKSSAHLSLNNSLKKND